MTKLCVFAGTTEGRELVSFLAAQPVEVTACVATEYGQTLLTPSQNVTVSAQRLNQAEMEELFARERFDLVIDATHPYADVVTQNIVDACAATQTPYQRLLRDGVGTDTDLHFVPDADAAAELLRQTTGNILLTTGSKELSHFAQLADRAYARVLPMAASLQACSEAGFAPSHIIAMQGPFSQEMNEAMMRTTAARYLVTKDSGKNGGFTEKLAAARRLGVQTVVIGRPKQQQGASLQKVLQLLTERFSLRPATHVCVVGIGMGHPDTMTVAAQKAIASADCLIGAQRMLQAVAQPHQATVCAIAPQAIVQAISEHPQYLHFAVVLSGDVGFFSGAKKLLPLLEHCQVEILPGISSLSYLCAKQGVSYEDVAVVSLHGRNGSVVPQVRANRKVFVLVGGEDGAKQLCRSLAEAGLGSVSVHIGQRLSYPNETIVCGTAQELCEGSYDSLSAVLIENPHPDAIVTQGLPDEAFLRHIGEKPVPMTKSEVRAVCLSKLALTRDAVCWDIGAGTGSVSVEMARLADLGHTYAIECRAEALELLHQNCEKFALPNLTIVSGLAPQACEALPAPTHVFVGGSSGNLRAIVELVWKKNPHAHVVATAIALQTVAELTALHPRQIVCLNVSRGQKAGAYQLMTANNPVYIFTLEMGGEAV